MEAEPRGALLRVLARILCYAGCVLGLAFLLALLDPGSETAHAEGAPAHDGPAVDDPAAADLWADPGAVSAAATRRAGGETLSSFEATPWRAPAPTNAPAHAGGQAVDAPVPSGVASTPIGSFGGGGGAPDAGPSIAQLAVLSAALLGVLWLSQRVLASELSWRSVLITSGVERPG